MISNEVIKNDEKNKDSLAEIKEEDENNYDEFTDANFIFETNSISSALINSLFAFKKSTNDYVPEIQKWEIYDWLASEDDFYVESIKSFYEGYNDLESDNRLNIVQFRTFCRSRKFLENSNIMDRNKNTFNKIMKVNKNMDII